MKILIVTGIFPPDIGGPATYVPQIAKGLVNLGHKITVITLSEDLNHDDSIYPFKIIRLRRGIFKPWRWILTVFLIYKFGKKADLIFVNGLAMEAVLANIILCKPIIMKIVGDLAWEKSVAKGWVSDNFEEFQKKKYGWKVEILRTLRTWWTRHFDKIIVPSEYLSYWVKEWGVSEEKIVVIYNSIENFNDIQIGKVPIDFSVKIITVGRLVPWKHIDSIIETVSRIDEIGLIIVGDGIERSHLEKLAKELIPNRVYFAGQRDRNETLSLMKACDIFILNSSYEGFPHVIIEAMGLGLAVIATSVGGTSEIVRNRVNGKLINPGDRKSLYEAIKELAFSPYERQKLAEAAQSFVRKEFNLNKMIEDTNKVFCETIKIKK